MKTYISALLCLFLLIFQSTSSGQDITYGIINKSVGPNSVTFDVTLSSTVDFRLGPGQVYFNYNTAAFGPNVFANGRVTISAPPGSVLGQQISIFPVYSTFTTNDNTDGRFSFAWLQAFSSGSFDSNITSSPSILFNVTMTFAPGGSALPDNICFESSSIFDDQTFTACGPNAPQAADCVNNPGMQITNDTYDCNPASLPVELVYFEAWLNDQEEVDLTWQTVTEFNNDYFIIEHATDDQDFREILRVQGAGTYQGVLDYKAIHENPAVGNNYYRLRQVDFDDSINDSEIRQVKLDRPNQDLEIQVFPNPTSGPITIQFNETLDQGGQLRIFNNLGQFVRGYQLGKGLDQQVLNLSDLHKGIYIIEISGAGYSSSHKILLQ
ncbi:MAG: T9SS type A sorting domain-containing protein [Bacteroidota bacterium]